MLFKDAKAGDKVAKPYRNGDIDRATISKVTPTQVVVGDERYRRGRGELMPNFNDSVVVRLKPWARALVITRRAESGVPQRFCGVTEDQQGRSRWQLWQLMQEVGPFIRLCESPFETAEFSFDGPTPPPRVGVLGRVIAALRRKP